MAEFERSAKVVWEGDLPEGKRHARFGERRAYGSPGQLVGASRVVRRSARARRS